MIAGSRTAAPDFADNPRSTLSWNFFLLGVGALPVSIIVLLLSWLIALVLEWRARPQIRLNAPLRWLCLCALLLIAVCPFSFRPGDSLLGLFNYLPFFLFFGLAYRLVHSHERVAQLLQVAAVSAFVTGVVGTFEWLTNFNWWWQPIPGFHLLVIGSPQEIGILDRVTAFFGWPTSAAAFFLLLLPVVIVGLIAGAERGLRPGWVPLMAFAAMACALVGTASRNAWGIAVLLTAWLLLIGRRLRLLVLLVLATLAILAAGLGPESSPAVGALRRVVPPVFWQKVSASVQTGTASHESLTNRYDAWRIALDMTRQRPLTGWGLQTFPFVETQVYGRDSATLLHAHNLYLTYTAEAGIPVALALVGFYLWTLLWGAAVAWKQPAGTERWQLVGLLTAVAGFLLFGISDVPFYDARINALFWLWLALVWRLGSFRGAKS